MATAGADSQDAGLSGRDADIPLSSLGRDQVERLGVRLADRDDAFDLVLCSPYRRARETLDAVEAGLRAAGRPMPPVRLDERLCDRRTGVLELLTPAAIRARHPQEAARMTKLGPFAYRPPGGESLRDVAARVHQVITDVCQESADTRVLVVAHDAVVLMLRAVIEGLCERQLEQIMAAGAVANASITRWVRHHGQLTLAEYNVTTGSGQRSRDRRTAPPDLRAPPTGV